MFKNFAVTLLTNLNNKGKKRSELIKEYDLMP